jgi:hypothetical protein
MSLPLFNQKVLVGRVSLLSVLSVAPVTESRPGNRQDSVVVVSREVSREVSNKKAHRCHVDRGVCTKWHPFPYIEHWFLTRTLWDSLQALVRSSALHSEYGAIWGTDMDWPLFIPTRKHSLCLKTLSSHRMHTKWHPIPYIVHYFGPGSVENRVPFRMQTLCFFT